MALKPVDKLLAAYLAFVTVIIIVRGPFSNPANGWMLGMHVLFGVMLYLFTRLEETDRLGIALHTLYPLVLLLPLYSEIGLLNASLGSDAIFAHDAVIQGWEDAVFGSQISYTWIRNQPSVFWSGLLHMAYFSYYPIVTVGPVLLVFRRRLQNARTVVLATMAAYVVCYVVFVLYPVAGPNFAFDHPTGPVRNVWSARLVYRLLAGGSSFGTAFPSSHVAASLAATLALWRTWKPVGAIFTVPLILLVVATVYCQMHYGIDATAGLAVGAVAAGLALRGSRERGAG
jgi:membrane-associated phospholipid phosphatase